MAFFGTRLSVLLAAMAALGIFREAGAWDATGHETVGAIADRLLAGTAAAARVQAILGSDLRTASVWADCAKGVSERDGEFRYHASERYVKCRPFEDAAGQARMVDFVRRNWDACDPARGEERCHKQYHYTDVAIERDTYARGEVGTSDHDIVAAMRAAILFLQGETAPGPISIKDDKEAVLMLAHYVGDEHQPLHVGAVYLDPAGREVDPDHGAFDPGSRTRGGNELIVARSTHAGRSTRAGRSLREGRPLREGESLHREWDDIPTRLDADHFAAAGAVEARQVPATAGPPSSWPVLWASDTLHVSHAAFQNLTFGSETPGKDEWPVMTPEDYVGRRETLQRQQLELAGARLAELMQALFAPTGTHAHH
jgi:hypothetical protein